MQQVVSCSDNRIIWFMWSRTFVRGEIWSTEQEKCDVQFSINIIKYVASEQNALNCDRLSKYQFNEIFPVVKITVCFYHFIQCLWRKVQELGLDCEYLNKENSVSLHFRMCTALAQLPPEVPDHGCLEI